MKRSKYLASVSITFSLILLLTFATPASALEVHIDRPKPRDLSKTNNFSITIYTKNKELAPIQRVDLKIYNENDDHRLSLICDDLPLYENTKPYPGTGIVVKAVPQKKWGYDYGYLQAEWEGIGYFYGYQGWGYGGYIDNPKNQKAGPIHTLPTYITYEITWDPQNLTSTWPPGKYVIEAIITANGKTFTEKRTDKFK